MVLPLLLLLARGTTAATAAAAGGVVATTTTTAALYLHSGVRNLEEELPRLIQLAHQIGSVEACVLLRSRVRRRERELWYGMVR
jgi:hypothetical protein